MILRYSKTLLREKLNLNPDNFHKLSVKAGIYDERPDLKTPSLFSKEDFYWYKKKLNKFVVVTKKK